MPISLAMARLSDVFVSPIKNPSNIFYHGKFLKLNSTAPLCREQENSLSVDL